MGRSPSRLRQEVTNTMGDEGKNFHIHRVFPCSRVADGMRRQKDRPDAVKYRYADEQPPGFCPPDTRFTQIRAAPLV